MLIAAIILILAASILLIYSAFTKPPAPPPRFYIPTPRGPLPVPTDAQLLAAREEFPPEHGTQRANGDRYCDECRQWASPLTFEEVTTQNGDSEGNEVTTLFLHACRGK